MSGDQSDPIVILDDGRRMPESEALRLYGNDPQDPWVILPDHHMMRQQEYLNQGQLVQAPDGRWMHANLFAFLYGSQGRWLMLPGGRMVLDDPGDPWVVVDGQPMHLSAYLDQGPMVTAPNGDRMHMNRFLYLYGYDPGDPWVFPDDGNSPAVREREYGPIVTYDGQQMTEGELLLTYGDDQSNPWLFLTDPTTSITTAIRVNDYEKQMSVAIESLTSLGSELEARASDVNDQLNTLAAEIAGGNGVPSLEASLGTDGANSDVHGTFNDAQASIQQAMQILSESLANLGIQLVEAAFSLRDAEVHNLQSVGVQPPSS